ncbi:MAG: ABC transporter permease [Chloroflexota bacterium]|jgi:peptide/nickel transport system permease protein|nr:ABC transporter permease [Chloroflexota bacterium]
MTRYLLGRLLSLLLVLFVVSVVTFVLMHSVPGGPFDESKGRLPEAARANIMRKYGLDKPIYVQYWNYMKNALRGDFGIPYQQPQTTVTALIAKTWRITLQVGAMTVLLAFGVGISLGLIAAYNQNSWIDSFVTFFAMLGFTVPNFVVALWLILVFAVRLKWLPMGGWSASGDCLVAGRFFCSDWIMPVVAYSLIPMAIIARYTRSSVVDVMRQDYARTARAKGLHERTIMFRHVFRNALIPMVTALGVIIPNLLTGSIFIETVFRINGMGKYFVTSIFNRDYPMIMALFLLVAVLWGVLYLLTDIAYTWIDPRVRLGAKGGNA